MRPVLRCLPVLTALVFAVACPDTSGVTDPPTVGRFDVRQYGARGDGLALDTTAVNAAIAAAGAAGGGIVYFPAGTYARHSIHLQSHITLYLDAGATISGAPATAAEGYDPPEPTAFDLYQDFGHSHFHNSS